MITQGYLRFGRHQEVIGAKVLEDSPWTSSPPPPPTWSLDATERVAGWTLGAVHPTTIRGKLGPQCWRTVHVCRVGSSIWCGSAQQLTQPVYGERSRSAQQIWTGLQHVGPNRLGFVLTQPVERVARAVPELGGPRVATLSGRTQEDLRLRGGAGRQRGGVGR